jgi:hypothetical protein
LWTSKKLSSLISCKAVNGRNSVVTSRLGFQQVDSSRLQLAERGIGGGKLKAQVSLAVLRHSMRHPGSLLHSTYFVNRDGG